MRPHVCLRCRDIAQLLLVAPPLASALSLRSLFARSPRQEASRAELLSPRQSNSTTPTAIEISPSQYWEGSDGPWSSFPIQVGTQPQNVRVMPATQAAFTVTISPDGCPSYYGDFDTCSTTRGTVFFPNESLTWVSDSRWGFAIEDNLDLDTDGDAGYDTVTLGYQGSGGPAVEHSVVFNLDQAVYYVGLFGLRPDPTNFSTQNDPQPSFMQQLVTQDLIPSTTYGYTAGAQYRLAGVFGSLVLGGYDENRFDGTKTLSVARHGDINRDLVVTMESITTDAGSPSNLLPGGAVEIFIDSTIGQLWLPESACTAFEQAFGLVWNNASQWYIVNNSLHNKLVSQNANVTFTLGAPGGGPTVDIVMPYAAFDLKLTFPNVINPNTTYYFPLKRAASESQYTLGRAILQESYIIVDYDNNNFTVAPCIWDQDKVSQSSIKSIVHTNETGSSGNGTDTGDSSSSNIGAIAGGAVGGVAILAIIAGVAFFLWRKRNAKRKAAELDGKPVGDGNGKASNDSGKPFISAPIGGELGGDGEIHELTAPWKQNAHEMDSPYKGNPNAHGYSEVEAQSYFAPGKHGTPAEMEGHAPIFEMAGSDVHEMPTPDKPPETTSRASTPRRPPRAQPR